MSNDHKLDDIVHNKIYEDGYVSGFHDGVNSAIKRLLEFQGNIIPYGFNELKLQINFNDERAKG